MPRRGIKREQYIIDEFTKLLINTIGYKVLKKCDPKDPLCAYFLSRPLLSKEIFYRWLGRMSYFESTVTLERCVKRVYESVGPFLVTKGTLPVVAFLGKKTYLNLLYDKKIREIVRILRDNLAEKLRKRFRVREFKFLNRDACAVKNIVIDYYHTPSARICIGVLRKFLLSHKLELVTLGGSVKTSEGWYEPVIELQKEARMEILSLLLICNMHIMRSRIRVYIRRVASDIKSFHVLASILCFYL